ncbi:MAG: ribonuclease HI [Thermodesulfovibrionales bacterium]|nr:ribonuclease HI [Thermodesulfovibrionales bacterium]
MSEIYIYADGACSGNPGVGGYATIIKKADKSKTIVGGEEDTTNNRMELMAVIKGLESIRQKSDITVITDSNYVVKGMTEWVTQWQKRGWKTSQNKEVLNRDLWERLLKAAKKHNVRWQWIKGHNGHLENETCDKLAVNEIKKIKHRRDLNAKDIL